MKIYIAGQITNLHPLIAADCFAKAARFIEGLGHEPLDPMKLVDQVEGRRYEEYLLDALRFLTLEADAVYMLANWRASKGARLEHAYADIYGVPVYYQGKQPPIAEEFTTENTETAEKG